MDLTNLDEQTRQHMLAELEHDIEQGTLYFSPRLSQQGQAEYPDLLRDAVSNGTPASLAAALAQNSRLKTRETATRKGTTYEKDVPVNANETLAEGEFNRFYARGLCRRAIDEGITQLRVYRAKSVTNPRSESEALIGRLVDPSTLLDDLRENTGMEPALGLPPGPNSGLSVQLAR